MSAYSIAWAESVRNVSPALPVCILMIAATCIGLLRLNYQSIWLDEYTTLMVSKSPEAIMNYCRAFPEQHPLYYFLVYLSGSYENLYKLRLLSLIAGVASLIPLFTIARKVASERAALLTCILFALSPYVLYYNQEGRMYTLLMLLVLCQVAFYVKWIEDNNTASKIGYFIFSVAALYTHFFTVFVLAGELFHFVIHCVQNRRYARMRSFILLLSAISVCYVPWLVFMFLHIGNNAQGWKGLHNIVFALPYTFFRFAFGYAVFPLNADVKLNLLKFLPEALAWFLVFLLAYTPAVLFYIRRTRHVRQYALIFLLALLPLCLSIALSLFKNIVSERYVIFSAPFFYMLAALPLAQHASEEKRLSLLSFMLPLLVCTVGLFSYYSNDAFGKVAYKSASQLISKESGQEDVVLVKPEFAKGMIDYYLKGARRTYGYESWKPDAAVKQVWIVEPIAYGGSISDISKWGYCKAGEKSWPQENGLRLSQWRLNSGNSSHPPRCP